MPHLFGLHGLCSFWTVWTLCNWFYGLYGCYRTIICPWDAVFGLRNVCVVLLYHFISVDAPKTGEILVNFFPWIRWLDCKYDCTRKLFGSCGVQSYRTPCLWMNLY
jgi:hypothetical protein